MRAVVFCFDKNYQKFCRVALFSLIINNGTDFKVYVIHAGDIDPHESNALLELCNKFFIELVDIQVADDATKNFEGWGYFTSAVFLRLMVPDLLKDEKQVLYLDCDLIVNGSIKELLQLEMGSYKYAGVIDEEGMSSSRLDPNFKNNYINSGVLLMNLEILRNDNSFQKMHDLYLKEKSKILWVDQCLINIYAHNNKIILNNKFNCLVRSDKIKENDWDGLRKSKLIYHFIGAVKPWHAYCKEHIFNFWWTYANMLKDESLKPIHPQSLSEIFLKSNSLEEAGKLDDSIKLKNYIINRIINKS